MTTDDLRQAEVFADQPEEELAWLVSVADEASLEKGESFIERNAPAHHMVIILEGNFQVFAFDRGQRLLIGRSDAGDVTGLLPFSRMKSFNGEAVALVPSRVASVHRDHFMEMITRMPEVGKRLVARMTDRVRERSRTEQQQEKMMSLGKLSAGLAHELNNPAAAIRRAVAELRDQIQAMPVLVTRIAGHGLTPEQVDAARAALSSCAAPTPGTLSALDRSDKEDRLADWLSDHGIDRPYVVAEVLAGEGITTKALDELASDVPNEALGDVLLWIEKGMAAERLLGDVERASTRISDLVASIKQYSHMDQSAERQPVDLHAGLDSTLTMLGYPIKKKSVRIELEYADDFPQVPAHPGELNQVWTNLIDNAIDAVDEGGEIRIATRMEGTMACVTITDNGAGIPEEVRGKIFDPFFTTKDPGEGTGLGLDIVGRIIRQHEGRIDVTSEPGKTVFEVCLPVGG
jgi:signal transduction histidine kinase